MKTSRFWIISVLGLAFVSSALSLPAQSTSETIYDLTVVDKAPEPKRRIKPDFPSSLKKRDTPAEITLRFVVTKEGLVTDINIVKFNDADMVDPAYVAYENAKFTPGEKGGKPVNTRMEVTEIFPEPKAPKKEKK
jgi:outer membrane biosynthesis protein TonB